MDSQDQAQRRSEIFEISPEVFQSLKQILTDCNNPFLQIYRQAREIVGKLIFN